TQRSPPQVSDQYGPSAWTQSESVRRSASMGTSGSWRGMRAADAMAPVGPPYALRGVVGPPARPPVSEGAERLRHRDRARGRPCLGPARRGVRHGPGQRVGALPAEELRQPLVEAVGRTQQPAREDLRLLDEPG